MNTPHTFATIGCSLLISAIGLAHAADHPKPVTATSAVSPTASSLTLAKKSLTLSGAEQVIAAIKTEAARHNVGSAIAVVDDGGNLIAVERLDGTFAAGANISIGKARTAAMFKRPTRVFEEIIRNGRTPMVALNDFTPLQGGVPIMIDGQVVGAVGVSGAASAQQDDEFAILGANAVSGAAAAPSNGVSMSVLRDPPMPEVSYFASAEVTAAFARGMPLIETDTLKVHASRREKPGQAEVHENETDVIYVLQGSATFVTGGAVLDGAVTAEGEIRGASIANGQVRTLAPGDVIVVPSGTPHWFKEIKSGSPFLYYVVKVIDQKG